MDDKIQKEMVEFYYFKIIKKIVECKKRLDNV